MDSKTNYYFLIGIGIILIFISSVLSTSVDTSNKFYLGAQIIDTLVYALGVLFLMFGLIALVQEKDKQIFNKIESHYSLKSLIIVILCIFVVIFNYLKISPSIILGLFSITVMLFLFTKLHSNKDKETKQLEIYIDSKALVTGVQISLILIFMTFYGYTFYNLWVSNTEPDPIIFTFIYITIAFLLLVEALKIIFIKIYQ